MELQMDWREKYADKVRSLDEAAKLISSGDVITTTLGNGIPYSFIEALAKRYLELENVIVYLGMDLQNHSLNRPEFNGHIDVCNCFAGSAYRYWRAQGSKCEYQAIHLSDTFYDRAEVHKPNVVVVQGAIPDKDGIISLGPCPYDMQFIDMCDKVIVQINENLPYVFGENCMWPVERVDCLVDGSEMPRYIDFGTPSESEFTIGQYIAEMIPDEACLQLGVGGVASSVGRCLRDKKNLGIHTEMFVDAIRELIECGAVTNAAKNFYKGKSVFGFAAGSVELYKFLNMNPDVLSKPIAWVNDPRVISQNDNMISINGAMQVDLLGQVCAESIGPRQFSGTGGQLDFVRGAKWSRGGKSFIALPSTLTDKQGNLKSKITWTLPAGATVTTPRADVQFVVTEYGIADLRGETIGNRVRKMIGIAHPDFRDQLRFEAEQAGWL